MKNAYKKPKCIDNSSKKYCRFSFDLNPPSGFAGGSGVILPITGGFLRPPAMRVEFHSVAGFTVRVKFHICLFCQPILGMLHKKIKVVIVNDVFVIILAGIH